jgi:hypothetical protein
MLKKIYLFHQIRQFYKTYGSELGSNFIHKVSDITNDNLFDVLFDINEVLEAYADCFCETDVWLNKLKAQINDFREPKHKPNSSVAITAAIVAITLLGGYTIGRYHTIRQAELLESTESEYHIGYGNEVHVYTFED